jgi:hypothetical protein
MLVAFSSSAAASVGDGAEAVNGHLKLKISGLLAG